MDTGKVISYGCSQFAGNNDDDGRNFLELNVELCEECVLINQKFSEVYNQLENIKMEVKSWLKMVLGKLEQAGETGKAEEFQALTDHELGSLNRSKLWNVELLRTEAIQQCFRKLKGSNVEHCTSNVSETTKECSTKVGSPPAATATPVPVNDPDLEDEPPPAPNRFKCNFCQTRFKSMAAVNRHFTEAHLASVRAQITAQKSTYLYLEENKARRSPDNINIKREVDKPNQDIIENAADPVAAAATVVSEPSSDDTALPSPEIPPNVKLEEVEEALAEPPPPNRKRKYECSFCEKRFNSKKRIYKHIAYVHLGSVTRPVEEAPEPGPHHHQDQNLNPALQISTSLPEYNDYYPNVEEDDEEEDYDPEMETACVEMISSIGDDGDDDDKDPYWTWTAPITDPLSEASTSYK